MERMSKKAKMETRDPSALTFVFISIFIPRQRSIRILWPTVDFWFFYYRIIYPGILFSLFIRVVSTVTVDRVYDEEGVVGRVVLFRVWISPIGHLFTAILLRRQWNAGSRWQLLRSPFRHHHHQLATTHLRFLFLLFCFLFVGYSKLAAHFTRNIPDIHVSQESAVRLLTRRNGSCWMSSQDGQHITTRTFLMAAIFSSTRCRLVSHPLIWTRLGSNQTNVSSVNSRACPIRPSSWISHR